MPLPRLLLVLLLALVAAGATAGPAQAGPGQISIMLDDDQLLYRGDAARDFALGRMKELGVDYVRVSVLWSVAAENARRGRARRRQFRSEDPSTYPHGNWDRYDRLVLAARDVGIGVYLNVTGPGPSWAHAKAPKRERENRATWKPDAREFGKFVAAVATRYSGIYPDENDTGAPLPRVGFWSIYNEPNQGGWLTPQYERRGGKVIPWTPVMYRDLWYYGRRALDDTGHGEDRGDVVLIGETAPLGSGGTSSESPIRPKKFIRELFCLKANGRRYTGRAAKARRCSTLEKIDRFRASAWAHHPYTKNVPPGRRDRARDSISMANISELGALLDQMAARTKRINPGMATIMTEFGFETDPPDRFSGVSLSQQAAFINEGDHLAYRDPRIFGQTQFLFKDVPPVKGVSSKSKRRWFTYQSGLYFANGQPKPAADAYKLPITVTPAGDTVSVWGQLRFLRNATPTQVEIQFRPQAGGEFVTAGAPVAVTNPLGFFEARPPAPGPGAWRALWRDPATGAATVSREVVVRQ